MSFGFIAGSARGTTAKNTCRMDYRLAYRRDRLCRRWIFLDDKLSTNSDNSRIGLDDTFVGKQPSTQPEFDRAGLLFLERVEEHLPGN